MVTNSNKQCRKKKKNIQTLYQLKWLLGLLVTLILPEWVTAGEIDESLRGKIRVEQTPAGKFHEYIPIANRKETEVLVVCHGSVQKNGPDALYLSRHFIKRWISFSEQSGVIIAAPVFDVDNFGSDSNPPGGSAWGYRALDGKKTGADSFVEQIVDRYKKLDPGYNGKFYLYGHSAGAQFSNHYLVVHPDRLKGVILSAAAIYAMPDDKTPWPMGMKTRRRALQWGNETKTFFISHREETWVEAVQVPIVVIVGADDTELISDKPQQGGWTRLARAQHYVTQMKKFAKYHGVRSDIRLVTVQGIGHSSSGLTPRTIKVLRKMVN